MEIETVTVAEKDDVSLRVMVLVGVRVFGPESEAGTPTVRELVGVKLA